MLQVSISRSSRDFSLNFHAPFKRLLRSSFHSFYRFVREGQYEARDFPMFIYLYQIYSLTNFIITFNQSFNLRFDKDSFLILLFYRSIFFLFFFIKTISLSSFSFNSFELRTIMHLIFINETWPYLFETDKNLSSFSTRISRASNLCLPFHRVHGYNFHLFLCRLRDNRENVGQVAGGKLIKHVPINFAPQHSGNVAQ